MAEYYPSKNTIEKFAMGKEEYRFKEEVSYPNGGRSLFYISDDKVLILDDGICTCEKEQDVFSYSLITDKQNDYMSRYARVYRLLMEDFVKIQEQEKENNLQEESEPNLNLRIVDRENLADVSPIELLFEQNFANVYGMHSLKYLQKEYGIVDKLGNSYFLDYVVHTKTGDIAVEENGISYHHPQVIGTEKYRRQLRKQNACTEWGMKLYRFSTEDCQFEERIEDDIKNYFGDDVTSFAEQGLLLDRKVQLYTHQEDTLQKIQSQREAGIKTFLIVFPTASGKSKIVEEDIKIFAKGKRNFKALIMAPNRNIIDDWNQRIQENLWEYRGYIEVRSFAYMMRHLNILVSGNLDSVILETDIPEEGNSLISLFTTYQVVRYCQAQSRFAVL